MAQRYRPSIVSFGGGEFSPLIADRTDLQRHAVGCRQLENFIVAPEGAAIFRSGLRFLGEQRSSAARGRIVPFVYSTEEAYVLELGANAVRFWTRDKTRIEPPAAGGSIAGDSSTFTAGLGAWTDASDVGASISHDAGLGAMRLDATPGLAARARLSVATTAVGAEHILLFRLIKWQYRPDLPVVVSGLAGISTALREIHEAGWHAIPFTPTASPFTLEFAGGLTFWVDNVTLHQGGPLELPTPWPEAALAGLKWSQSNDVLYLVHPDYPPHKLERYGNTGWSLKRIQFKDGPYLPTNTSGTKLKASAATGIAVTIEANGPNGINEGKGFLPTDVGRPLRMKATDWGWAVIIAWTDATHVTACVVDDGYPLPTDFTAAWRLGRFHDAAGWPAAMPAIFEERLGFSGQKRDRSRYLGSCSGEFETFSPTMPNGDLADDRALDRLLADNQVNAVRWLAAMRVLLAGTTGAEWRIGQANGNAPLKPDDIPSRSEARRGSADIMPAIAGNALLYVQRGKRRLRELIYDFAADGYSTTDLTAFASHISASGFRALGWAENPSEILWCIREDGALVGLSYNREQERVAWHRHPMTNGACEDIAVIPGDEGNGADQLWLLVRRTVNGTTKRYLEVMEPPFGDAARLADAWFLDAALPLDNLQATTLSFPADATEIGNRVFFTLGSGTFTDADIGREVRHDWIDGNGLAQTGVAVIVDSLAGTAEASVTQPFPAGVSLLGAGTWRLTTTIVSGLGHLEGLTVGVCGDGRAYPDQVVTGGVITLPLPGMAKGIVGLRYRGVLEPIALELTTQTGSTISRTKRIVKAWLSLLRSVGGRFGRDIDTVRPIAYRRPRSDAAAPPSLFSGHVEIDFLGPHENPVTMAIVQDDPFPLTVRGLVLDLRADTQ